jgi:hypothetical protein
MKIGFYSHHFNELAAQLREITEKWGHDVFSGSCLCNQPDVSKYDIILCHPTLGDYCCSGVKTVIEDNPEKMFYIFSIGVPDREKLIGRHPNAIVITEQNRPEVVKDLINKLTYKK